MDFKGLVNKLDRLFSKYIRLKYRGEYSTCYTCGKAFEDYKLLDCGHYIGRAYYSHRWDESNCRPQCRYCNRFNEGNKGIFRARLIAEYGDQIRINEGSKNKRKPKVWELEIMIKEITEKLTKLGE